MRWRDRLRAVQCRMKNEQQTTFARELRKNMTAEERKLWYQFLRDYPVRIMRQRPIDRFIVDFYCARAKLVIELDGSQHYETAGHSCDKERDRVLRANGFEVLRIPNNEVNQSFLEVCEYIDRKIKERVDPSVSCADSSLFRKGAKCESNLPLEKGRCLEGAEGSIPHPLRGSPLFRKGAKKEHNSMKTVEIYTDGEGRCAASVIEIRPARRLRGNRRTWNAGAVRISERRT